MLEDLYKIAGKEYVHENEPMSKHTTFRAGGNARYFVNVQKEEVLVNLLQYCKTEHLPYYILGNGSNLLVRDEGYAGVMIKLDGAFKQIWYLLEDGKEVLVSEYQEIFANQKTDQEIDKKTNRLSKIIGIKAGAAAILANVSMAAANTGLTGMEFAFGIPGSVGGAMVMNAGAYGGEMKQVVKNVSVLKFDSANDKDVNIDKSIVNNKNIVINSVSDNISKMITNYTCEEMQFGYRDSLLKNQGGIALYTTFSLDTGNVEEIKARMDELTKQRREKQPLEYPSAGSTFKRPEGYFAGKLIQDAGLKGYRVGDAMVSEKHAGFVVNIGNATATDVITLISDVSRIVKEQSGVTLEPEVIIL